MSDARPDPDVRPDHDVRGVLAITAFRRLWLSLGLSSFGDWLGLLAVSAFAFALLEDSSPQAAYFAFSGVLILRLAPAIVFGPLAGVVADRLDRRLTMVVGDLLRFALFVSIPVVGKLWWLFVATVLVEIVGLFWMPAKDASVPNLVPPQRLEAANQLQLATTYGSAPVAALFFTGLTLLGGALDDVLAFFGGPTDLALYVNALTYLVAALVIWRLEIPPPSGAAAAKQTSVLRSITEGWRFVGDTALIRGLVIGMLGAFAAAGFVLGLARPFVSDLGAGDPGFGLLFASVFLGLAAGMWLGPRMLAEVSRRRLFGLSLATAGVFLLLIALVANIVLAVFFTLALGASAGVAWVTGYTMLGSEVADEVRGRTFAFVQSTARVVLLLVMAAAPAIAGLIGNQTWRLSPQVSLSYGGPALTFAIAGLLAGTIGVISYRQMDDSPGVPLRRDLQRAWKRSTSPGTSEDTRWRARDVGFLMAFEGGDGAGKSTQARLVAGWLSEDLGHEVVLTHEPGATPLGSRLREVLLGDGDPLSERAEALLFAADRAEHVSAVLRPALNGGAVVITDRYVDSSIAYQGAGRSLAADEVAQLSRWATDGLVPDLTVVLDLMPLVGRHRRGDAEDRLEAEPDEFHERVRQGFLDLAAREPRRYLVLDASEPVESLQERIRQRLRETLPLSARQRAELEARLAAEAAERERREAQEVPQGQDEEPARHEAAQHPGEETQRRLEEAQRRAAVTGTLDLPEPTRTRELDLSDQLFGSKDHDHERPGR